MSTKFTQNITAEVVSLMLQMQKLIHDHPEVQELEINPLMINREGIWAADVKIKTK